MKAELLSLSRSWVVRGWIIALVFTEFVVLTGALAASRAGIIPASTVVAAHLNGFVLVWSLVIIVLGAGSVSMEQDVIADSILSRSCTRTQYIAAKLAARAFVVLGVFLISSSIAGLFAYKYAANDMTLATLSTGIFIDGLAVLLLLALGIALSVVFNNTVFAIVGSLLLWYVAAPIFSFLGAEYLSPTSLTRNLPRILKDPSALQLTQATATQTSLTVVFSKRLDPGRAEDPVNYLVESEGQPVSVTAAVYDETKANVVLQGLTFAPGSEVRVSVRNVTDTGGREISPASTVLTTTVPSAEASPVRAAVPSGEKSAPTRRSGDRSPPRVESCTATQTSIRVVFSKPMNAQDAEDVANYLVENPPGTKQSARAATYTPAARSVLLSGMSLSTSEPVTVTVMNAKDAVGNPIGTRNNSATYSDVTTWKYILGFGIPTITAFLISIIWFSKRDL